jgi:hypothetical protein
MWLLLPPGGLPERGRHADWLMGVLAFDAHQNKLHCKLP